MFDCESTYIIIILLILILIQLYNKKSKLDGFTPSTQPLHEENTLFHMNPFDNDDYQTPAFYVRHYS